MSNCLPYPVFQFVSTYLQMRYMDAQGASMSQEPSPDLELIHEAAANGLAALLSPRLPIAGLHSPERTISPRSIPFTDHAQEAEASRQEHRWASLSFQHLCSRNRAHDHVI